MGYTIYFSTVAEIDRINQNRLRQAAIAVASAAYHNLGHAYTVIKDRGDYLQLWTTADNAESLEISYTAGTGLYAGSYSGFCKTFRRDFTLIVAAVLGYAQANGWVVLESDDDDCELYQIGLLVGAELARLEAEVDQEQLWQDWDIVGQCRLLAERG